ncbi:MAG: hypothetical protein WD572_07845 [Gammaproteobacteria bacterium]
MKLHRRILFIGFALLLPLSQALAEDAGDESRDSDIAPGTLVIPQQLQGEQSGQQVDKQCMKVCVRWGEDCIIDPVVGTRKCRRSCKEFGEQCF